MSHAKERLQRKNLSKKREGRQQKIRLRKNFFPTLLIIVILWSAVFFTVYFIDPFSLGAIPLFFLLLFLSLFFTLSALLANTKRGFIMSLSLTIFFVLRYHDIGNILNLMLIAGIAITAELFFSKSNK